MKTPNKLPKNLVRAVAVGFLGAQLATAALAQYSALILDPHATARLGYFPAGIALSETKPVQITKEPAYRAKPKYGIIHLGNGPKSDYVFALDEPKDADAKIYIDKNQNGDLTDDGDGAWNAKRTKGRVMYGVMHLTLRASYGTKTVETSSSPYTLGLYRFPEAPSLFTYRESGRRGRVFVGNKAHNAVLVENDSDAIFSKTDDKGRPLWLLVDLADDGKYVRVDPRQPFNLGGKAYEAKITQDGFGITLASTTKPVAVAKEPPPPPPLLKNGVAAPDFVAEKWGGGSLHLSDYKGKVVILDFWATWCGPCQKSMPHIEEVKRKLEGQDVVVVGVCVWDEKDAYNEWVPKNSSKYSFQFAFDPAGRKDDNIAGKLFHVSGIPTTYIIDKNGNVADSVVGYDDGDKRVEDALKKIGIKIS